MARSKAPATKPARKNRWTLHPMPEGFRQQQAIPDRLPVPTRETDRIDRGAINHAELSRWIFNYLEEHPDCDHQTALRGVAERFEVFQQAVNALNEGDCERAEELFRDVIAREGSDHLAKFNLASALERLGRQGEALDLLADIKDLFLNHTRFTILCSRCFLGTGKRQEAIGTLREALERNQGNFALVRELQALGELVPVVFNANDIRQTKYVTRDRYHELVMEDMDKRLAAKEYDVARRIVDYQVKDGKHAEALSAADAYLEKEPEDVDVSLDRTVSMLALGQKDEAVELLEELLKSNPGHAKIMVTLGRARHASGDPSGAAELFAEAFEKDQTFVNAAELLILCNEGEDARMEGALELARKYPDSWVPKKLIGDLEFGQGQVRDALAKHLEVWSESDSDDALTMIIHEYDKLNETGNAIAFIDGVKSWPKRSAAARWNAANVSLKAGRTQKAIELLTSLARDASLPHETRFSANSLLADINANTSTSRRRATRRQG